MQSPDYVKDDKEYTSDAERNQRLRNLIITRWLGKPVTKYERVDSGRDHGWRAYW